MRKRILLSIVAVGMLGSVNVQAADSIGKMFEEGKASGEIRAFYINRDNAKYLTAAQRNDIGTSLGGHLKYETGAYNGLSLGTAFYTTNRIVRGLEDNTGPNTTLFANDGSSYSLLGEAYVQYNAKDLGSNTVFKIGRQKLNTPLAGADDARMLPNLFEAYVMQNTDIANTTIVAAHVTKMAPGSFANAYGGTLVGVTAGYSYIASNTPAHQGTFTNMGTWALGDGKDTKGVTALGAIYKKDNLSLQAWDYYAHDILNAIYLQADMSYKVNDSLKPFVAAQYINQSDIGSSEAGKVSSDFIGVKAGASIGALKAYVAYSQQSKAEAGTELENSTISPWGGMPAFTQGMVTRHQFIAGTKATKVAATYNFKEQGVNLSATGYYANFKMDTNTLATKVSDITSKEHGFDIQYHPAAVKNLLLRLRGNYARDFYDGRDWNEYRFIASYKF